MKRKSGIYVIINKTNSKKYYGSSVDVKNRFRKHKRYLRKNEHDNKHLQNAWNKYGEESFKFNILLYCDKENLIFYEQLFLDTIRTINKDRSLGEIDKFKAYNNSPTAGNCLGVKHSEEVKKKQSEASKKMWETRDRIIDEEIRKKISNTLTGKKLSEETRNKISQANRDRIITEKTRNRISQSNKGKIVTEETREKIRNTLKEKGIKPPSQKGVKQSQDAINKRANSNRGKKRSEEFKKRMSEMKKADGIKPPSQKGKKRSKESRQRMSEAQKARRTSKIIQEV